MIPLAAGGAGIGLLWGWVTGSFEGRISSPAWSVSSLVAGTLAIALIVLLVSGLSGLIAFLVSSACALGVHAGWRRSLRYRLAAGEK